MKTRNYGIDFLRMISMIMIVMLHTLGHGGILRSVSFLSVHYQIAWLLEVIAFGAVNTYAMISGFVSVDSHFKISNILIPGSDDVLSHVEAGPRRIAAQHA